MKGNAKNPADWLRLVRTDQARLDRALAADDLNLAWYHAEQAAEKAMKGWLIGQGWSLVKTHDLVFLSQECLGYGCDLSWFLKSAIRLKILLHRRSLRGRVTGSRPGYRRNPTPLRASLPFD